MDIDDKFIERLQKFSDKWCGGITPTMTLANDIAAVFGQKLSVTVEPARETPEQTIRDWHDR